MRHAFCWLAFGLVLGTIVSPSRANFIRINVDRPATGRIRAIWKPCAGVEGDGFAQQATLWRRSHVSANAASAIRCGDERARDTVVHDIPVVLTVDMTAGPVIVESLTSDSVRIAVQLTPERGPRAEGWGRKLEVRSDGRAPSITRIR